MVTIGLNKIAYLIIFPILISCENTLSETNDEICETYVAGNKGFWLDVYAEDLKDDELTFTLNKGKITPKSKEIGLVKTGFFITDCVKLSDTLSVAYKSKVYKIYDFKNLTEIALNGSNHKKNKICRVSTAKVNGKIIPDSDNNVLKMALK